MQDLEMPERITQKTNAAFFEKQWNAVASFWYNRVLKEKNLQSKTVAEILQLIEEDIDNRWNRRKMESSLHKKRKRLLEGRTNAGKPSTTILVTNICSYSSYMGMSQDEKDELHKAIQGKIESFAVKVADPQFVVDTDFESQNNKQLKVERHSNTELKDDNTNVFDDRVAFICKVDSTEAAANVIARLHGAHLNERTVLCRFWHT